MAFTVTDDHARQEQVWAAPEKSWSKEPYQIRRMLTETSVKASDRRVLFVGIETYEAAGGVVMRDLFAADNGGWLEDVGLLDRLVGEKLKAAAETVAGEGWKWIEVAVEFSYGYANGLRVLKGTQPARAQPGTGGFGHRTGRNHFLDGGAPAQRTVDLMIETVWHCRSTNLLTGPFGIMRCIVVWLRYRKQIQTSPGRERRSDGRGTPLGDPQVSCEGPLLVNE